MTENRNPNLLRQILAQKKSARALGVLSNSDLSKKFKPGEKLQPKIRRGGRNGSGKP